MRAERISFEPLENSVQTASPALRIAERAPQTRISRLVDLAYSLLKEAEVLARDKTFADENARVQSLNFTEGIDFYGEVERFEVGLIKRALEETHGNQAKAAKLLRIKPTTLNSKIKLYQIEF
jgi:transcriptional regulator with PAS, ATPase and Fis domain